MAVLHNIYFSGKGTTKACAECIGGGLDLEMCSYDWLVQPCEGLLEIPAEDVLLFCMPVYGGFIPKICADMAENLKGSHTPAVIAAVYGNRHYDNALLQMKDILTARGFRVIAAGAFLAEHSIFPSVAAGRPDESDRAAMAEFAARCRELLDGRDIGRYDEIHVPGAEGYDVRSYKGVPLKPDGDDRCIRCGKCANICPCRAISGNDPRKTDPELCISCGACIHVCPTGARNYHDEMYQGVKSQFQEKCAVYRLPETYYITAGS